MSYQIPLEIKVFPQNVNSFKDFIKSLNIRNDIMVFLSQGCYSWLKDNSTCINQEDSKVFSQQDNDNITAYISTINIDSSNCSFLKNILSKDYNYDYTNGIPKKVIILMTEYEYANSTQDISVCVIESTNKENPVDCIIDNPDLFDNSIIFLTPDSYKSLKKNTNTISNLYSLERLIWAPDDTYPGGDILLHRINCNSLYIIYTMIFPFFKRCFSFKQIPKSIYFIS